MVDSKGQGDPIDIAGGIDAVRSGILEQLRTKRGTFRTGNGTHVNEIRPKLTGEVLYQAEFEVAFYAGLWTLVNDGIIAPGAPAAGYQGGYVSPDRLAFPIFTLTPFGRAMLHNTEVVDPGDSNRYLDDARARLGIADDVIYTYLAEANKNLRDRSYLSATVMLGVSAELLMKWLIDRFVAHVPASQRGSLELRFSQLRYRTDKLFDAFVNALREHYVEFPRDLQLQTDAYLDLLQTLIRINRDDVGHGRAQRADAQLVHGNLLAYLTLLKLARELADTLADAQCTRNLSA